MISYQGKNVVIIGLGITGLSCVDYFLAQNVIPKVIDTRQNPAGLDQLDKRVPRYLGDLHSEWINNADLIVVSPGIALSTNELQQATDKGIEIIGDIELFCREVNQQQGKKIVAITGSNGKTTVTTLVGEIVKGAGLNVGVGGNIGEPALSLLQQNCDIYVLELSSFQLETTKSLRAEIATILNISEDHMNRYPEGLQQYVAAKQRIYHNAEYCLINHDDKLTSNWETSLTLLFDLDQNGQPYVAHQEYNTLSFGLREGDYYLSDDDAYLVAKGQSVLATANMHLTGRHNYLNALAALAIADKLGINRTASLKTITDFHGLSHRFELVLEKDGVKWINDSKATNVGSTEAALNSVVCQGKLYLLLGGDGKAADFSPLIPHLQHRSVELFCFGRDRVLLAKLKPEMTTLTETMAEAMSIIATKVNEGDVVLLSPACASLDQFKNYVERGVAFAKLAKTLTSSIVETL